MDYGSDLDLLVVFDDAAQWPPAELAATGALKHEELPHEFYARFTSELVRVLASITREGLLYRVDLRLRPEGKNGPLAQGLNGLVAYLTNRASAWEHSAYLKAREVAGVPAFGARARRAICEACFAAAAGNANLREGLAAMRERIQAEKAGGAPVNVKWGRGGMTDVYFVTRYLQLNERIYFPPDEGTAALIRHLGECGALDAESTRALFAGYTFLRRLDHWMRLLLDRPTPVLPASDIALNDLARALGIPSLDAFEQQLTHHLAAIRAVYDRVFED
jgi:glutamate-ammonia-ligase adenylyltransferase